MPWMIPNIAKNLTGAPATRKYPFEKRPYFPGARGRLEVDFLTCTFCGLCERVCPAQAIKKIGDKKDPDVTMLYKPFACIYCARCAEVCKFGSIKIFEEHTAPADRKLTLGREGEPVDEEFLLNNGF